MESLTGNKIPALSLLTSIKTATGENVLNSLHGRTVAADLKSSASSGCDEGFGCPVTHSLSLAFVSFIFRTVVFPPVPCYSAEGAAGTHVCWWGGGPKGFPSPATQRDSTLCFPECTGTPHEVTMFPVSAL